VGVGQGDQIWQIFAYWAIVFLGQFFESYRSSRKICATFIHRRSHLLIWEKLCLGYILGDVVTNSSNHNNVGLTA
jgi:hypothetical protein